MGISSPSEWRVRASLFILKSQIVQLLPLVLWPLMLYLPHVSGLGVYLIHICNTSALYTIGTQRVLSASSFFTCWPLLWSLPSLVLFSVPRSCVFCLCISAPSGPCSFCCLSLDILTLCVNYCNNLIITLSAFNFCLVQSIIAVAG